MRLAPDDPRLDWRGLVELVEERPGWWRPWRLPHDELVAMPAGNLAARASEPAGVRLLLRTDASELSLTLDAASDECPLDVVVAGEVRDRIRLRIGEQRVTVPLPVCEPVEIWLPQFGGLLLGRLELPEGTVVSARGAATPGWTAYGSSITQCRKAFGPASTWPGLVSRAEGWDLFCQGFGGECHLDPVAARTIRDHPADLISLCLGINIHGHATFGLRTLVPAIGGFVATIREKHPTTPLLVIGPVVSPPNEDRPNALGLTLADVRAEVARAAEVLAARGEGRVAYLDGRDLLGPGDASLLYDGIHPSGEGYELIAERSRPVLRDLMAG